MTKFFQKNETILFFILILLLVFLSFYNPQFYSIQNINSILRSSSTVMIVAFGMTILLTSGEVDLSVGALLSFVTVIVMDVINISGSLFLGFISVFIFCFLIGLVNGLVRTVLNVNSLIGTLAMMLILQGSVYIYSMAAIYNTHLIPAFTFIGQGFVYSIPMPVIIMLVILPIFVFLLNYMHSPETIRDKKKCLTLRTTFIDFRYLFKQSSFLYFAGVSSIQAAFFFSMAGFMPYQFERLGASPTEFGLWFSLTSIGYIIGNLLSNRYSNWLGLERFSLIGCSWCLLSIILMFLSEIPVISTPLTLASACFLFGLGNGLILANVLVLALSSIEQKRVASASGILGAMQMFCGAILGSLIVLLGGDKQFWLALTIVLILSMFSILCCYRGGLWSKTMKPKN